MNINWLMSSTVADPHTLSLTIITGVVGADTSWGSPSHTFHGWNAFHHYLNTTDGGEQSFIARHCCPLSIFCCRLKSHLFSLSYPAFLSDSSLICTV